MLETLTHHTPAGTSTRTVVHYGRNYESEIKHWLRSKLYKIPSYAFAYNIAGPSLALPEAARAVAKLLFLGLSSVVKYMGAG